MAGSLLGSKLAPRLTQKPGTVCPSPRVYFRVDDQRRGAVIAIVVITAAGDFLQRALCQLQRELEVRVQRRRSGRALHLCADLAPLTMHMCSCAHSAGISVSASSSTRASVRVAASIFTASAYMEPPS